MIARRTGDLQPWLTRTDAGIEVDLAYLEKTYDKLKYKKQ